MEIECFMYISPSLESKAQLGISEVKDFPNEKPSVVSLFFFDN
jgi:hypothetical protein